MRTTTFSSSQTTGAASTSTAEGFAGRTGSLECAIASKRCTGASHCAQSPAAELKSKWKCRGCWQPDASMAVSLRPPRLAVRHQGFQLRDVAHLVEKVICARGEAMIAHEVRRVIGEHDDERLCMRRIELPGIAHHGDAVALGELDVDDEDVKYALFEVRQRLGLRGRLRGNCHAARIGQQIDKAAA